MRTLSRWLQETPLDLFGYDVRRAVFAVQQFSRFRIADYRFTLWIELNGAAQAIGCVGQVNQRGRKIALANRRVNVFRFAALDAVDEVVEMLKLHRRGFGRTGFFLGAEKRLIGIVVGDR